MKQSCPPRNAIDAFIADIGGTVKVAQALGLSPTTVSSWRASGRIPRWRMAPVLELALREGKYWPEGAVA